MLKMLLMLIGLIFLVFLKNFFWLAQNMIFLVFFFTMIFMNLKVFPSMIAYFMGIDILSFGLVLLSLWVIGLMFMSSEKIYKYKNNCYWFSLLVLLLLFSLMLTFSVMNLFMFYFFFEMSLIPTFFLILGWGYQPERLQAGVYLLFYTLFASLPLLMGVLSYQNEAGGMHYYLLDGDYSVTLMYFCFIMAFLVKMPMFFLHLWLPSAHVEAPVSGSMVLAGILLKLGGYGLMRFYVLIQTLSMKYNLLFYVISLVGGVLISLVCLMQVDIKALIAYSSVVHMGVVIGGLVTLTIWGVLGSYVLMIGHGLCSSGLFCLSNIVYERTNSRSLYINKGLLNFMPSLALWWFLLLSSNMAAPPSLNLFGEIFLFNALINWSWLGMVSIMFISFFSAAYSLYLFSMSQHGRLYSLMLNFSSVSLRESFALMLHWLPLNLLVLSSEFCILWV